MFCIYDGMWECLYVSWSVVSQEYNRFGTISSLLSASICIALFSCFLNHTLITTNWFVCWSWWASYLSHFLYRVQMVLPPYLHIFLPQWCWSLPSLQHLFGLFLLDICHLYRRTDFLSTCHHDLLLACTLAVSQYQIDLHLSSQISIFHYNILSTLVTHLTISLLNTVQHLSYQ